MTTETFHSMYYKILSFAQDLAPTGKEQFGIKIHFDAIKSEAHSDYEGDDLDAYIIRTMLKDLGEIVSGTRPWPSV